MRRVALAGVLLASVLAASVAFSGAAAAHAETGTPTNETVQELRERVDTLEDENADLKTKVVERDSRIQELELQLDQQEEQHDVSLGGQMQSIGAWHPEDDGPAVLYLSVQEPGEDDPSKKYGLFQFCGPGNGNFDFNNDGVKSWCEIPIEQAGDTAIGPIRIQLLYAPPGMNTTHEFSQANAQSEVESLARKMNDESGFLAWARWNNRERHESETMEKGSMAGLGAVGIGLGLLGAWIEFKTQFLLNRRREKNRMEHYGFLQDQQPSRWSRLKDWLNRRR